MKPIALVTGVAGDIGRAIASVLSERYQVAGCDIDSSSGALPAGVSVSVVDVTDAVAIQAWVDVVGSPQVVVINAAIVRPQSVLDLDFGAWKQQIDVNLNGAFVTAQAAARAMVSAGNGGHIVFVGSWAAHAPDPAIPAYCAAKAGLRMLMRCTAIELAPHGIQVNEVAPGYVDAGLSAQMFRENPSLRAECEDRVPLGRLITVDEVAEQVQNLVRPENRHMTGSVVVLDGGLSLLGGAGA